jgi:hypothetical protein
LEEDVLEMSRVFRELQHVASVATWYITDDPGNWSSVMKK